MVKGPLGFEVVDCAVTLVDGSYHSVDSSELAFRMAGRIAMHEALANASPRDQMDISSEQERAGDLVRETRLYRQTAAATGDSRKWARSRTATCS